MVDPRFHGAFFVSGEKEESLESVVSQFEVPPDEKYDDDQAKDAQRELDMG